MYGVLDLVKEIAPLGVLFGEALNITSTGSLANTKSSNVPIVVIKSNIGVEFTALSYDDVILISVALLTAPM